MSLINEMLNELEKQKSNPHRNIPIGDLHTHKPSSKTRNINKFSWTLITLALVVLVWLTMSYLVKSNTKKSIIRKPTKQATIKKKIAKAKLTKPTQQKTIAKPVAPKKKSIKTTAKAKALLTKKIADPKPATPKKVEKATKLKQVKKPKETAKPSIPNNVIKKAIPLTPLQQANKHYQAALNTLNQGKLKLAAKELSKILFELPSYQPARVTLVTLLLRKNALLTARTILDQGLALTPHAIPFIMLSARISLAQDNKLAALKQLSAISPPLETHLDYYAMIAAIQQQLGHYEQSARWYEKLLYTQPDNGIWWMGYGIALEALGHINQANDAYQRALNTQGLNPNLQYFVSNRLKIINHRQE